MLESISLGAAMTQPEVILIEIQAHVTYSLVLRQRNGPIILRTAFYDTWQDAFSLHPFDKGLGDRCKNRHKMTEWETEELLWWEMFEDDTTEEEQTRHQICLE